MRNVIAHDGTVVTPKMLDQWSARAEAGHLPGAAGPIRRGRPLSIGE